MKSIEILALGIRFLGIYIIFKAIQLLPSLYGIKYIVSNTHQGMDWYLVTTVIIVFIILLVMGLFMLKFPVSDIMV